MLGYSGNANAQFLVFEQKLLSPEQNEVPWGYRIAIEGDKLLISNDANDKIGAVDYYQKDINGIWQPIQRINPPLDLTQETGWANFGLTDLQGDSLLVGAPFADHDGFFDAGEAFLFHYNAQSNQWDFTDLFNSSSNSAEFYGNVSLDTNRIAIGATHTNIGGVRTGSVYLYEKDTATGSWQESQTIEPPFIDASASFGFSILLRDDELFINTNEISATQNDGLYLFKRDAMGQYVLDREFSPDGNTPIANFGVNVQLEGNYLIISAADENLQPAGSPPKRDGAVYFYIKDNQGQWVRQQKIISRNLSIGGIFGNRIELKNNILLITESMEIPGIDKATFQTVVHQYYLDTTTNLWQWKQTIAYLEPGTYSQTFTGLGFDGTTAALWAIESSTGKRISGVYTMKMVPENKIDLTISNSIDDIEVNPGDNFVVHYIVINQGQDTATGITFATNNVNFISSSINCSFNNRQLLQCGLQDLQPGESQSFNVTYQADPDPLNAGILRFIATVATTDGEADSTNNGTLIELNIVNLPPAPPSSSGGGSLGLWFLLLAMYSYFINYSYRLTNRN